MSRASALPAAETRRAAALFSALADATRLRLVARMATAGPEPIVKLSAASSVSRQAITKHLRVLARADPDFGPGAVPGPAQHYASASWSALGADGSFRPGADTADKVAGALTPVWRWDGPPCRLAFATPLL